jgi:hypothetical protein
MLPTYVAVTLLAVAALTFSAGVDFARHPRVAHNMDAVGIPQSWMTPLGVVKALGAAGLLIGFAVPALGVAAGVGVVAFFVAAVGVHLRARHYDLAPAVVFGLLGIAALVLRVVTL